jgi:multiple sugar transport system permease protein/N-acetylglucosamine transport system permease protein
MEIKTSKKRKRVGEKRLEKGDLTFILLMMLIPMLHFLVFCVYINVDSILMAFQDVDYDAITYKVDWVGLDNFKRFVREWGENDIWKKAIFNSLGYLPCTVAIMLPVSIVAGYFLYRKIPLAATYKIIFFLPSIISIVVLSIVFKNMFDASIGPVNWVAQHLFNVPRDKIPNWLVDEKHAMNILYVYSIWAGIGYNVVLLFGAMSRVPTEVVESGRLDGVGTFREIFQIFVPIIWPTISTMIIFGVTTVFTQYLHPMVLTAGAGKTWTVAYIIVNRINQGALYYGAALGIMLVVVAVPVVQFFKWLANKAFETVET